MDHTQRVFLCRVAPGQGRTHCSVVWSLLKLFLVRFLDASQAEMIFYMYGLYNADEVMGVLVRSV